MYYIFYIIYYYKFHEIYNKILENFGKIQML